MLLLLGEGALADVPVEESDDLQEAHGLQGSKMFCDGPGARRCQQVIVFGLDDSKDACGSLLGPGKIEGAD